MDKPDAGCKLFVCILSYRVAGAAAAATQLVSMTTPHQATPHYHIIAPYLTLIYRRTGTLGHCVLSAWSHGSSSSPMLLCFVLYVSVWSISSTWSVDCAPHVINRTARRSGSTSCRPPGLHAADRVVGRLTDEGFSCRCCVVVGSTMQSDIIWRTVLSGVRGWVWCNSARLRVRGAPVWNSKQTGVRNNACNHQSIRSMYWEESVLFTQHYQPQRSQFVHNNALIW